MKKYYIISLNDSQGRMQSYRITATTLNLACAAARTLAGVADDAETSTTQNMGAVDHEAE